MPPTLTPAGRVAKAKAGLAYLVASSTDFQTACGVPTATDAMDRIATQADDTAYSVELPPRALILRSNQLEEKIALQDFRMTLEFYLSFEFYPSDDAIGNRWDEEIEFDNRVDAITAFMFANQGIGTGYMAGNTHVAIRKLVYQGGGAVENTLGSGNLELPRYFYAVEYTVEVDA